MTKKKLGKGLDALLSRPTMGATERTLEAQGSPLQGEAQALAEISIADIKPSPFQPRRAFAAEALDELAASIQHMVFCNPSLFEHCRKGASNLLPGSAVGALLNRRACRRFRLCNATLAIEKHRRLPLLRIFSVKT